MSNANNLDWGYSVNRHMDAARKLVASGVDVGELINGKIKGLNAARETGAKDFMARQDVLDEVRALIGAGMEAGIAELDSAPIASTLLDVVMQAEHLRATDPVHDEFSHQLKLANLCEALTGAVAFLLAKHLVGSAAKEPSQ